MTHLKRISLLLICVIVLIFIVAFKLSKHDPVVGEATTMTTGQEDITIVLSDNSKENYLNLVNESISASHQTSECYINSEDEIVISTTDILNDKDIAYIKSMMDSLDDVYWGYEDTDIQVKVILNYNQNTEIFFIQKNSEN